MKADALQQGVYDRLSTYAPLTSLVSTRIYADAPQPDDAADEAEFPYITIGPFEYSHWDTKDTAGQEVIVQVHVWARSNSLAWRAVSSRAYDALNRYKALNVSGAVVSDILFESGGEDIGDPDGKTSHVPMIFRIRYEDAVQASRLRSLQLMAL